MADPAVQADPANAPVLAMLQPGGGGTVPSLNDSSFINNLDPRLAQPFLDGFAQSVDTVLLLAACIMAVGVILTVMLPELPLRNVSGIQGRFDEAADAAAAANPQPSQAVAATAVGGVASIVADDAAVTRAEAAADERTRRSPWRRPTTPARGVGPRGLTRTLPTRPGTRPACRAVVASRDRTGDRRAGWAHRSVGKDSRTVEPRRPPYRDTGDNPEQVPHGGGDVRDDPGVPQHRPARTPATDVSTAERCWSGRVW